MSKRFHIILSLILLLAFSASAEKLIPFESDGKWGYMDVSGKVIIPLLVRSRSRFQ